MAAKTSPIEQQQRIDALWARPVLTFSEEVPEVLQQAKSTLIALRRKGRAPKTFKIGRVIYSNTSDVRAWLESDCVKTIVN